MANNPKSIQQDGPREKIPIGIRLINSGISGMAATCFVQPLDLLKNRMQLSGTSGKKEYRSSFHALRSILANEGGLAFYNGLSAGLARQATYTTIRLGFFSWSMEKYEDAWGQPIFAAKLLLGMTAGGIASLIGNPTEIALVRMTADGRLPVNERRNYNHVLNAISRICKEEGVSSLWRGCAPTVVRSMVVNATQLGTYSQAKQQIIKTGYISDGILCHFCASMISGFATTAASMPVDIVKTRIQNMRIIDGKPEYNGILDVFGRILRNEGLFSLWKGFTPYFMRLGPHTVLTFIFFEQLCSFYSRAILRQEPTKSL